MCNFGKRVTHFSVLTREAKKLSLSLNDAKKPSKYTGEKRKKHVTFM